MTLIFHWVVGVSLPDMVGILSGAVTNTPALGAAQQTLKQMHIDAADPALGCAVTYPLGVVGVILAVITLRKMFPRRTAETKTVEDKSKHTFIAGFEVRNPGIFGKNLKEVAKLANSSLCGVCVCGEMGKCQYPLLIPFYTKVIICW